LETWTPDPNLVIVGYTDAALHGYVVLLDPRTMSFISRSEPIGDGPIDTFAPDRLGQFWTYRPASAQVVVISEHQPSCVHP
jgi:hypothetical protein